MPAVVTPVPNAEEVRANATFEALMWALSRPGTPHALPAPGMAGIAEALVDRECSVHAADPALRAAVAATGAALVEADIADYAFLALDGNAALAALAQVPIGSALCPDQGATVVAEARLGEGPLLRLSGPGVDGTLDLAPGGLHPGLWRLRQDRCRYPEGFDLFLLCGAAVVGLPRSTLIEVR